MIAKKEFLTFSVQNSLVPLLTSRKHISHALERKIFHGCNSKYYKPSALYSVLNRQTRVPNMAYFVEIRHSNPLKGGSDLINLSYT